MVAVLRTFTFLLVLFTLQAGAQNDEEMTELVAAARQQIGLTTSYDPAYRVLEYPGGDVPLQTGVCTDVLVRAYRDIGLDLQKLVHEDMAANFADYPQDWGLSHPDPNIDHRRVPNLMQFFSSNGDSLEMTLDPEDYHPGHVVAWRLDNGRLHIGLASDRRAPNGNPLIIHNIGSGAREEDILFQFEIIGHYRYK
jgi:uncharacterized protein YijF (DUF1287 family)